jgi:membrane fusion protein, multidrug efflux system
MRVVPAMAVFLLAGCGKEPHKTEAASPPPATVQTITVQEIEWPSVYEATGTVRARVSASLASKVMGYIRELRVNAGDAVKAGQLIAIIDSRELEAGLQLARAIVQEARSGIAEADNAIAAAKAHLELASVTFQRIEDLYDKRSISNQEFDEAKSRLRVAQAGHEMALAKRRQLDARVLQTEQSQRAAEVTRSYAEVRSPFNGIVIEKRAEQGDMATPGAPLIIIEQAGAYQLEVAVEEARLGSIRIGQPVSVVLDAAGRTIAARVAEIMPAVDTASRSFLVKVLLPSGSGLHSGVFGRAQFTATSRPTIAVPQNAVTAIGQIRSVAVVEDGIARMRLVSLGERSGSLVEVLSGLTPGDRVVTPRPANLTDGRKVQVRS